MVRALPLDKIVIDCGSQTCTQVPWHDPTTVIPLPFWESGWMLVALSVAILALIVGTSVVRWRRHERLEEEHSDTERTRQTEITTERISCPTCGTKYRLKGIDN